MSLAALQRYARRTRRAEGGGDACELCAAPAGEEHAHVLDLEARTLRCACAVCARLFAYGRGGSARYRTVPSRVLFDPGFAPTAAEWAELRIPVGLAFASRRAADGRWVARFPSPAGALEAELPEEPWGALAARTRLVACAEPDVEALLFHGERGAAAYACLLVPIDACYALVGRIRRRWRGFDGGDEVRREIAEFVDALRRRAEPVSGGGVGAASPGGAP